jgi:HK97 family phage portal protein
MLHRPQPSGRFAPRHRGRDPREAIANDNGPGPNTPPETVGPTSSTNAPGNVVVGSQRPVASPWSGWPTKDTPGAGGTWGTPPMERFGDIDAGGGRFSGYGYGRGVSIWGRVSTAMTCVDLNSRQLGSFPIYGMKGEAPVSLPSWSTNPEPEVYASWGEFVRAAVNSMLLRGECILYVTGRYQSTGLPARFTTINPDTCDAEFIDGRWIITLHGGTQLPAADVHMIRYQVWDPRGRGISPLDWIGRSMLTSGALERYATNLANRGGIPWAVLKSQKNIDGNQALDAQMAWVNAGQTRDGAPAVIGNAFDLVPLQISPRDMALLELREFDERRICAAFGVPAYLVNVEQAGGMTYANASDLRNQHWQATLRTLADMLATGWSGFLLPRGTRLEFNPDRYVQPAFGERVGAYQTMFNIVDPATGQRGMELSEIRSAERLHPIPEDDPTTSDVSAARLTGART